MAASNPTQAQPSDAAAPISPGLTNVGLLETTKPSPFEATGNASSPGQGLDTCREEEPLNKFDGRLRRGSWMKARSVDKSMDNIAALAQHHEEQK
jgi:hypothetical protein